MTGDLTRFVADASSVDEVARSSAALTDGSTCGGRAGSRFGDCSSVIKSAIDVGMSATGKSSASLLMMPCSEFFSADAVEIGMNALDEAGAHIDDVPSRS